MNFPSPSPTAVFVAGPATSVPGTADGVALVTVLDLRTGSRKF